MSDVTPDRAPLPLAERGPRELRRRAACGDLLRSPRRQPQHGRGRERRGARRRDRARRAAAARAALAVRARADPVHAAAPPGLARRRRPAPACTRSCSRPTSGRPRIFRDRARHRRARAEEPARAGADRRADLRHQGERARPGALLLRPWRQGRHALSGRPRRPTRSRSRCCDRALGRAKDRSLRAHRGAEAPCRVRRAARRFGWRPPGGAVRAAETGRRLALNVGVAPMLHSRVTEPGGAA